MRDSIGMTVGYPPSPRRVPVRRPDGGAIASQPWPVPGYPSDWSLVTGHWVL